MDSSNLKESLKSARDHIAKKEFEIALEHCESVLKLDEKNYNALVFYGLCLSELGRSDEAFEAYNKATQLRPSQITGWQGFASFYAKKLGTLGQDRNEKHLVERKLAETYRQIAFLFREKRDTKNFFEFSVKARSSAPHEGADDLIVDVFKAQIQYAETESLPDLMNLKRECLRFFSGRNSKVVETEREYILHLLEEVERNDKEIDDIHLTILYMFRDWIQLFSVAENAIKRFPETISFYEWIGKVFIERLVDEDELKKVYKGSFSDHFCQLLHLDKNSVLGNLALGTDHYVSGDYVKAKDILTRTLEKHESNINGTVILARCLYKLEDYSNLEKTLTVLNNLTVKEEVKRELLALRVKMLYKTCKFDEAYKLISNNDEIDTMTEIEELKYKIRAFTGHHIPSTPSKEELQDGIHAFMIEDFELAESILTPFAETEFEATYLLGRIHLKNERFDKALNMFLKSAKLNQSNPLSFKYLGLYYKDAGDLDKARKCLQRSFRLDSSDEKVGSTLSDVYRIQGDVKSNLEFLLSIASNTKNHWAYLRLGIHYLDVDEPSKAIPYLQSSLRFRSDENALETLADAYFARGSFTSALKVYERVTQMKKEFALYSEYQIAVVKQSLGHFTEAITVFERVLDHYPSHVPSLKSVSECHVALGYIHLEEIGDLNLILGINQALREVSH